MARQVAPPPLLEVCIDSIAGAIAAEQGGAQRVELCANLLEGGTTPSPGTLATTLDRIDLDVFVLVRPRGGDFLYSDLECEVMSRDIEAVKAAGASGVVIGVLDAEGRIDIERSRALIAVARPMQVTFHRAFDMTRDPFEALEALVDLGVERVLTSGQKDSAGDSIELLADLIRRASDRIIVMPGGGVDEDNIRAVVEGTGAREVHFAARVRTPSRMTFKNPDCGMGSGEPLDEFEHWETDLERVRRFAAAVAGG